MANKEPVSFSLDICPWQDLMQLGINVRAIPFEILGRGRADWKPKIKMCGGGVAKKSILLSSFKVNSVILPIFGHLKFGDPQTNKSMSVMIIMFLIF